MSNLPPVHFPCQLVVDVNHRAICPKLAFQWREQATKIFYSIRVNFSGGGQCNWTKYLGARWKSLIWKIEWEIENWLGSMNKKKFKRDIEVLRAGGRAGDEKCPALMSCDMSTVTLASNCDLRWQNDCAHALTNTRIQMYIYHAPPPSQTLRNDNFYSGSFLICANVKFWEVSWR